ncbi:ABC transporter ATP-binding protein [Aquiflexum sp. TKW24L]|uniref:ABC transporter ATP-binding protein n=1 Tax=Aquiflexum sp. TKW24L TaxID=2942212 RepID=UPI0020C067F7|nr:ABC transporter ATP-binding protein [Aquiflexum sp. TKW24L]MCL6261231.1 ABC transporter ATP-binding protein [Aquiflexum sp. TKW24L]
MAKAIKVENLSKAYQLGQFGTNTISGDVQRWWTTKILGKEDPFHIIGESNVRSVKGKSNIAWSLKDINFEVQQGEALGIIGQNGAGKSTLLKILSRVTSPTQGGFKIKGRVASLLEVGTGFHPELSGKENIFLNGAILGMRKHEIKHRLDEIVDFAGIERYLETPVKRYSSGMYVRLAFAVAAHLDAEILIVDEVLAVGDAEFQKKCIGKMGDIRKGEGRTILFVSHNLVSVKALCSRGILLENGQLLSEGNVNDIIQLYREGGVNNLTEQNWEIGIDAPGNDKIRLKRAAVFAENKPSSEPITTADNIVMEFDFLNQLDHGNVDVTVDIFDSEGVHVTHFGMICDKENGLMKGLYRTRGVLPCNLLNTRRYIFHVLFGLNQREVLYRHEEILIMEIEDAIETRGFNFAKFPGIIHPVCSWETKQIQQYEN